MRTKECFYRGYRTLIEFDSEDQIFYGKIEGIKDLVDFEGNTFGSAQLAFHEAVNDYLITKLELMITEEMKQRFLFNRDETGRFIVKSFTTGKEYYVEPIGDGRVGEWGSYNPGTGNIEHKKGAGKYTGSVKPEESLITEENGFINIWETPVGSSPFAEIERRDKEYESQGIKPKL